MSRKKRIAFLCGGISGEHEISLISCKHVIKALDRNRYEPLIILIQKDRRWELLSESVLNQVLDNPKLHTPIHGEAVDFRPYASKDGSPGVVRSGHLIEIDAAFPVLHGEGGEDGSIQGFFMTAGIPVVGCDLTSSALGMDKSLTKKICKMDGIPVVPFFELQESSKIPSSEISYPCFVKPSVGGSSLGVSRVESEAELKVALTEAFRWCEKVLVEPAIDGRELEIAVLQDAQGYHVSPAGEIICQRGSFYSYEAKYVDEKAAQLVAPAKLGDADLKRLQDLALRIFKSLGCSGMARIDFFMDQKSNFLLNEINTIPGFTPISMYPKLMGLAGVSYPDLLNRLIENAFRSTLL